MGLRSSLARPDGMANLYMEVVYTSSTSQSSIIILFGGPWGLFFLSINYIITGMSLINEDLLMIRLGIIPPFICGELECFTLGESVYTTKI